MMSSPISKDRRGFLTGRRNSDYDQRIYEENQIQEAIAYFNKGNKAQAWYILNPIAISGNAEAQYVLGYIISDSPEIPDHKSKAIPYLRNAADSGHVRAKELLHEISESHDKPVSPGRRTLNDTNGKIRRVSISNDVERQKRLAKYREEDVFVSPVAIFVDIFASVIDTQLIEHAKLQSIYDSKHPGLFKVEIHLSYEENKDISDLVDGDLSGLSSDNLNIKPDINSELAREYGITDYPAVRIHEPGKKPYVVSTSNLAATLDALGRKYYPAR